LAGFGGLSHLISVSLNLCGVYASKWQNAVDEETAAPITLTNKHFYPGGRD
jgi:hypothetical protein